MWSFVRIAEGLNLTTGYAPIAGIIRDAKLLKPANLWSLEIGLPV